MEQNYNVEEVAGGVPVKMWTRGVPVEDEARKQLANAARLPVVFKHIAAMPDVHLGIGATVALRSQLYRVGTVEWTVLLPVGAAMMALSLSMAYLSARPWLKVDPMEAVRHA